MALAAPHARAEKTLEWDPAWPRFRKAEIALTGGLSLQVAAALFLYPPAQRNWEGGILFDDAIRRSLVLSTPEARKRAGQVSDYIYYGLATLPMVVDVGLVAGAGHGSGDVAVQMLAIDLESYALAGAVAMSAEKAGRVRPVDRGCRKDPSYSDRCGKEEQLDVSFMSGHTTIAFTGAALTCAHHQYLPLYGGGAPDVLACGVSMAAATTAGVLRISSDSHYATDVLLGAGVGIFAGYGLPRLLHYGRGKKAPRSSVLPSFRSRHGEVQAVLAPTVDTRRVGVSVVGTF